MAHRPGDGTTGAGDRSGSNRTTCPGPRRRGLPLARPAGLLQLPPEAVYLGAQLPNQAGLPPGQFEQIIVSGSRAVHNWVVATGRLGRCRMPVEAPVTSYELRLQGLSA